MNTDTVNDTDLIADAVDRLFAEQVDQGLRERAEAGALDAALWGHAVGLGLPLLLAAEAAGGLGQPFAAAYPVLRAIGHAQVPLPLAETMVAAQLLSLAGLHVPDVSAGPLTLIEQSQCGRLHARADGDTVRLSGVAHRVPWARHAQSAVVSLTDGRLARLELRGAEGVTVQGYADTAGMPSDTLVLHEARCAAVAANPLPLARPVWTLGAAARSAMMVGALEWTLAQTVGLANDLSRSRAAAGE